MPVRPIMTFRQDERTASCLMKHAQEFTDRCDGTADGLVKRESLLNFALGNMRSASRAQWALSSIALAALVDGAESGRPSSGVRDRGDHSIVSGKSHRRRQSLNRLVPLGLFRLLAGVEHFRPGGELGRRR